MVPYDKIDRGELLLDADHSSRNRKQKRRARFVALLKFVDPGFVLTASLTLQSNGSTDSMNENG